MKFLLDENVPISIKKVIQDKGFEAFTLHDFNMLGIQNGKVAELALNNNAIILTLDSDFLNLNRNLQLKSRIVYIKLHPRDPVKLRKIVDSFLKKYSLKLNNSFKLTITETDEVYEPL